jgi:phosphocarrier protein
MSQGNPPQHQATLQIRNEYGLHLRAARRVVETAEKFEADITVARDDHSADGKSIMGLLMLAAEPGSEIVVTTSGPQAAEALEAIRALVDAGFPEEK